MLRAQSRRATRATRALEGRDELDCDGLHGGRGRVGNGGGERGGRYDRGRRERTRRWQHGAIGLGLATACVIACVKQLEQHAAANALHLGAARMARKHAKDAVGGGDEREQPCEWLGVAREAPHARKCLLLHAHVLDVPVEQEAHELRDAALE